MELRSYLPILRAHWVAIILLTLLGGAVAFGWTLIQPKVYTADSSGIVSIGSSSDSGNALVGDNLAKSKVKSYLDIGESRAVAQHAIDELGLSVSPESLVGKISISNPTDTAVLKVTANGATPEAARDLAEAWINGIQAQITTIESAGADPATASPSIVQLIPLDSAVLPSAPSSPNVRLAIVIGLIVGLIAGIAYAAVRHIFDRRIRSPKVVEAETGHSVVGTIPIDRRFTDKDRLVSMDGSTDYAASASDDRAVAEAMREVRTNIQFMNVDNPPRVIVVTSPLPGDGKSTTVANLAIAISASGQQVVLIDADLRRPTVAKTFNLVGGAGLTDVLAGRSNVADVLQPWGTSGNLLILAAGQIPPNPSELLGSVRMHELVASLAEHAIVLIDAPPLLPVTDAAILTHNTDGALIVASVGKTTIDALTKALSNVERANGTVLGVILNRVPRKGAGSSYYGYRYGGDYHTTTAEAETEAASKAPTDAQPKPAKVSKAERKGKPVEPAASPVAGGVYEDVMARAAANPQPGWNEADHDSADAGITDDDLQRIFNGPEDESGSGASDQGIPTRRELRAGRSRK
ncbi:polysaccharide biosynthesis tyrosine autokinase [Herbiconiux sp. P16]|uniref:polysaccharide biosynthesis tyrosine autokinase n=1 Tax=Herbiconiux wuyangfengii TaxID=3342794 RepID=UPI003CEC8946